MDPHNPSLVYAAAGILYRSRNGGETWKALIHAGSHVVLDPAHPSTIYAIGSGLVRSTDWGQTWETLPLARSLSDIRALAVVPGNPSVVLVGGSGGFVDTPLHRSTDGGRTWSAISFGATSDTIFSIAVEPGSGRTVYCAGWPGVFKSSDAGASWSRVPLPANPDGQHPFRVSVAPSSPGTVYAMDVVSNSISGPRIFRSDDSARSWRKTGELPTDSEHDLLVDPRSPSKLYLPSYLGIFVSVDSGGSWTLTSASLTSFGPIYSLAVDPSGTGVLYAGLSEWGVAKSVDDGQEWRIGLQRGLTLGTVWTFELHPRQPDTIYLGLGREGERAFFSRDGGRSWQPFNPGYAKVGLIGVAFDPTDPDVVYATNRGGLWKSRDGGRVWKQIDKTSTGRIAAVVHQVLLAGRGCGLGRSTDAGRTWKTVIPCEEDFYSSPQEIWVDPRDSGNVYALMATFDGNNRYGHFLARSRDGGVTWQTLDVNPDRVAVAASDFRTLYVSTAVNARLLRSVDGGESWQEVQKSHYPDFYSGLAVDASDPRTLYLVFGGEILRSRDGGVTLEPLDEPLELRGQTAWEVFTDRNHPGLVYATGLQGGLFKGWFE